MGLVNKKDIKKIILEYLEKIKLDEVLEPLKTSYLKKVNQRKFGFLVDSYLFETNKNNKYVVDFFKDIVFINAKENFLIILGFSTIENSEIEDFHDENVTTLDSNYIKITNKKEQYEVLGKVVYLIQEYIKNNPNYSIFGITKNTHKKNLIVHNKIYEKIFKNNFIVVENDDIFYYIKRK